MVSYRNRCSAVLISHRNRWSSVLISDNQWSSVVISGHQSMWGPKVRRPPDEGGNQSSSVVISVPSPRRPRRVLRVDAAEEFVIRSRFEVLFDGLARLGQQAEDVRAAVV